MLSRTALKRMPDDELIASLKTLLAKQSQLTAELLTLIAEAEDRKLYLVRAYGSMFKLCVDGLGLTEPMAYKYIGVARAARKHEAIFEMVRAGTLHLSTTMLLVPHLTAENCAELLEAAAGRSKRQVEKLIAERFPRADVQSQVRKLPQPSTPQTGSQAESVQAKIPVCQEPVVNSSAAEAAVETGYGLAEAVASCDATSPGHGQPARRGGDQGGAIETGANYSEVIQQEFKPSSGAATGGAARTPGHDQPAAQLTVQSAVAGTGSSYSHGIQQELEHSSGAATIDTAPTPGHDQAAAQLNAQSTVAGTGSSSRQEPKPSSDESNGHGATAPARKQRPRIEPLAPARYKVQFTAGEQLVRKLRQAQELLRHQVPDGDLAAICERALDLLIATQLKKRFATGSRKVAAVQRRGTTSQRPSRTAGGDESESPSCESQSAPSQSSPCRSAARSEQKATVPQTGAAPSHASGVTAATPSASASAGRRSRYIPAPVRRLVADRDGLQCTFVGPDGRRCESRDVEFHHLTPFARGGEHSAEQITLRCRAHNAFQAELDYGAEHVAGRIRQRRARSKQRRAEGDRPARLMPAEPSERHPCPNG